MGYVFLGFFLFYICNSFINIGIGVRKDFKRKRFLKFLKDLGIENYKIRTVFMMNLEDIQRKENEYKA